MPTSAIWATNSASSSLDAKAWNRFKLVECAAGVAQAAPAHLGERHIARCYERPERDRRLVADAAGRMLVDSGPTKRGQIDDVTTLDHGLREHTGLGGCHSAKERCHEKRGHLVVGHLVARVREDQLAELSRLELMPSRLRSIRSTARIGALDGDDRRAADAARRHAAAEPGIYGCAASPSSPSWRAPFAFRPST